LPPGMPARAPPWALWRLDWTRTGGGEVGDGGGLTKETGQ
jgi:hypothetical protein